MFLTVTLSAFGVKNFNEKSAVDSFCNELVGGKSAIKPAQKWIKWPQDARNILLHNVLA
jgi:hypothetical protein